MVSATLPGKLPAATRVPADIIFPMRRCWSINAGTTTKSAATLLLICSLAGCGYTIHEFPAPTRAPFLGRYAQRHYFQVAHAIPLQAGGIHGYQWVITHGPPALSYEYDRNSQQRFSYPPRHDSDGSISFTDNWRLNQPDIHNMQVDRSNQDANDYAQEHIQPALPSHSIRTDDDDGDHNRYNRQRTDGGCAAPSIESPGENHLMPGTVLRVSDVEVYRHEILVRGDLMGIYSFGRHVRILISASQQTLPSWANILKRLRYYLVAIPRPAPRLRPATHVRIVATPSVVIPAGGPVGPMTGHRPSARK